MVSTYNTLLELTDSISTQLKYYIRHKNTTIEVLAGKLNMSTLVLKQIVLENKVPLLRELVDITTELNLKLIITLEDK